MRIKNHFHINGFALSLALEQKLEATRKRPTLLPDWLLKVIWWNFRLTTQMRRALGENQRYSSFEFLLTCLREQTLLRRLRNRPLEGNNEYKNTPGRVSGKFTSLNNHQWPRLLCQRDVQTHYSSFPWTQMPWHSIVDKKTPMSQQEHLTLSISTLTFSPLFFIRFLRQCLKEFVQPSRHFILCDQLIYSHDLNADQAVLLIGESGFWSLL